MLNISKSQEHVFFCYYMHSDVMNGPKPHSYCAFICIHTWLWEHLLITETENWPHVVTNTISTFNEDHCYTSLMNIYLCYFLRIWCACLFDFFFLISIWCVEPVSAILLLLSIHMLLQWRTEIFNGKIILTL